MASRPPLLDGRALREHGGPADERELVIVADRREGAWRQVAAVTPHLEHLHELRQPEVLHDLPGGVHVDMHAHDVGQRVVVQ